MAWFAKTADRTGSCTKSGSVGVGPGVGFLVIPQKGGEAGGDGGGFTRSTNNSPKL